MKSIVVSFLISNMFLCQSIKAQKRCNLADLASQKKLLIYNRSIVSVDSQEQAITIDERPGEGIVWINSYNFATGFIEVDLKGKDMFQKSFLGIAFHGVNDSTYEAVYFRPFNFNAKDSVRRIHAVQYINHPEFTWKKLRDEKNAIFEKEINPKPDPNNWFHATIKVTKNKLIVYVNDSKNASLKVHRLNKNNGKNLGLWLGDGSGGEFKNLVIH